MYLHIHLDTVRSLTNYLSIYINVVYIRIRNEQRRSWGRRRRLGLLSGRCAAGRSVRLCVPLRVMNLFLSCVSACDLFGLDITCGRVVETVGRKVQSPRVEYRKVAGLEREHTHFPEEEGQTRRIIIYMYVFGLTHTFPCSERRDTCIIEAYIYLSKSIDLSLFIYIHRTKCIQVARL